MKTQIQSARDRFWPMFIVGLLVAHVTLMMVAVRYATGGSRGEHAIVPNYYEKAVAWDASRAAQSASDKLKWQARWTTAPATDTQHRTITLSLTDSAGHSIDSADVTVNVYHLSHGDDVKTVPLMHTAGGAYEGVLSVQHSGFHQFDVTCKRRGEKFVSNTTEYVE